MIIIMLIIITKMKIVKIIVMTMSKTTMMTQNSQSLTIRFLKVIFFLL